MVGAGLRLYGLDWDQAHHLHPDERHITIVLQDRISLPWPPNLQNLLDPAQSTLNPRSVDPSTGVHRSFAYGSLPLYIIKVVAHVATAVTTQPLYDYDHLPILARLLSVLADLGTVVLVFLLGRRLYGSAVGLLGAAFVTFAVIHIQLAHFLAFDVFLTFFIVATVYFASRIATEGGRINGVLAGVFFATALATKISVAPLGLAILAAYLLPHLHRHFEGPSSLGALLERPNREHLTQTAINLCLTAAVTIALFALFEPYAILDPRSFLTDIGEQSGMVRGLLDYPYTRQYVGTIPLVYQLKNLAVWGTGLPLGIGLIAALAGFFFLNLRRPRKEDLLVLSWVIPYLLITATFEVKFLRYMLPLVPFLCLMLAAVLCRWRRRRQRDSIEHETESARASDQPEDGRKATRVIQRSDRWKWPAMAVSAVLLISAVVWSVAFLSIYGRPHSRIEASRWIYDSVPRGSVIGTEGWDDSLPLGLSAEQSPSSYAYRFVSMGMYDDLPQEAKLQYIDGLLHQVDYIALTSNRLYGSIPRLPWRYPVTIEYYRLLFHEKLGFQLAGSFTSYPTLLGRPIVDDTADESFTVYDHPKVLIFKKTRDLTDAELRALFSSALAQPAIVTRQAPPEKSLLLDQPVDQLPVADDYAWNPLANASALTAIVFWYIAVQLLGLLAWPIAHQVFGGLRDRGYALAKIIGVLLLSYLVWISTSLQLSHFTVLTVVAGVLVLAGLAIYLTLHQRAAPISFLVQNRKLVLLLEATFTLAFAVFVGIRYLNPDLWQPWFGGEKPMEFAFLNATLRSPTMPPYDPWFAGGYVNYYYFGQFIVAVLVKLVGVAPRFAFNLAVPTLFALAFVGIFSLGYDFTVARAKDQSRPLLNRAIVWGLVAAGFVVIAGNLDGLLQFLEIIRGSLAGQGLAGFDFWRSTRIIPGTINEFPFFTFLFADLHAHMVSLPITIVVLGLALNLVPRREDVVTEVPLSQGFSGMVRSVATLVGSAPAVSYILLNAVISALVLGALAVTNSWDFPTYLLILLGAMVLVAITRGTLRRRIILVVVTGVLGLVIATMSLGLYWPFFFYFKSFYSSVALERSHTDFPYYVVIFGLFLFVIISFLVHALARRSDRQVKEEQQNQLSSRPEKGDAPAGGELSCRPLTPVVEIPGAPTIETPGRFMASGHLFQSYESGGSELPRRAGQASSELPEPNRRADSTLAGISSSRLLPIGLVVLSVGALGFLATQGLLLAGFLAVLLVSLLFAACLRSSDPGERFVLLVIFAGLTVSLGVELFYLVDFLQGGDYHRMNTVFKFYNQVWVLLALGSALALSLLFGKVRELVASNKPVAARIAGVVWLGVLAALLVGVAIYPILGTNSRVQNRFPGEGLALSLDGLGYMATGKLAMRDGRQIDLAGDYDAIEWLLKNVKGTPVILEASIGPYRGNGSRIANNTGLPTPLGWDNHESQQRYPEQIAQRVQDVRTIYNTTDIDLAMSLLRRYRVKYVYVGQIERYTLLDQGHLGATTAGEPYASVEGLKKFDAAVGTYFDVVYSNPDVKIYQVRG